MKVAAGGMMGLRGRILCLGALLLIAGAAQAERISEPYATAGDWEISAENHHMCAMTRRYGGLVPEEEQGLMVIYDPQRQLVSLNWAARKPQYPPTGDKLPLGLAFLKGSSMDESWGNQTFQIEKREGYLFTNIFAGTKDAQRILHDVASNRTLALFLGPSLMMSLYLDGADAVAKLRESASKMVQSAPVDPQQK